MSIDPRIAAVESQLAALGSKITPIEAEVAVLPAKLRRLQDDATALNLRVVPLEQHKADVDIRIAALAGGLTALQNPPPPTKSFVDMVNAWAEPAGKIVIPILVLVVAWFIKDSVDAALKEREIEVSTAQAMNSQLTTLRAKNGLTQPAADAAALVLSTFGRPSIMLLIREHDFGTVEESLAADKGLLVLGLTHKDDLCPALDTVLRDKGERFRIETHALAAKHIGQARCEAEKNILVETRDWIKSRGPGDAAVVRKYREKTTVSAIDDLRRTLDNALSLLQP